MSSKLCKNEERRSSDSRFDSEKEGDEKWVADARKFLAVTLECAMSQLKNEIDSLLTQNDLAKQVALLTRITLAQA